MTPEERWLRSEKRLARPWPALVVLFAWAATGTLALQAWLLADVVSAVVFEHQPVAGQWPRLWSLLGLVALRALFDRGAGLAAAQGAIALQMQLRERLFHRLRRLGPAWVAGRTHGALATALTDGVEALGGYYRAYLPAAAQVALLPLTLLAFILPRDWLSGLILLGTAPLVPFFMILIGKGAERRNQRQWRRLARMGAHFLDVVRGLPTLRLLGAAGREARRVAEMAEGYRRSTLSVLRIAFLSSFTLEFFATVSIAVVAVVVGFRLYWGELEFRHGFFVLLLAPEFYLPLRRLGTAYHDRMEAIGAAGGLLEILEADPPTPPAGRRPFRPRHATGLALELRGLHYRWPEGRGGIGPLELTVAAGERVALVGPSGAGKSTLFQLLLGFVHPDHGELLVDGQPLARLDPHQWRAQLAWVPQQPHLFHGSVLDNLRLANPEADRNTIEAAAAQAHCLEFIEDLPQGFDTLVGEGGRPLSGGQIQRLALARAFLRPARLVLLDEPTAHLDLESEALVQQAVDRLARRATLLVIAHRLQTVRKADRILVLEQGRVVEQGRHETLAKADGPYRRLLEGAT